MITISALEENGTIRPERSLTAKEQLTVTSSVCNGVDYIYYQGDEPIIIQEDEN